MSAKTVVIVSRFYISHLQVGAHLEMHHQPTTLWDFLPAIVGGALSKPATRGNVPMRTLSQKRIAPRVTGLLFDWQAPHPVSI